MNMDTNIYGNPSAYSAAQQVAKKPTQNATRSTTIAQATQALANQTGGNIMGFTYE